MTFLVRHPFRVTGLVLLAIVAGCAVWLWKGVHSSTAASENTALADFRAAGGGRAPARQGIPAAGVYAYRQTGSESAGSGPLSASRDYPARAVYIINHVAGGYHEDLRMSGEHIEEVRFRVDARGSHATWRRTKVTFLGIGTDDRNDVSPPSLDHPSDLHVGRAWHGRYRSGPMTVTFAARVLGTQTVTVGGRRLNAFEIRMTSDFTGPTSGHRTDTFTWAPSVALPVRWRIQQSTKGDADFTMDATLALESTTPQT